MNNYYQEKEFQSITRADIDLGKIGKDSDDSKKDKSEDNTKDVIHNQFDDLKLFFLF